MSLELVAPLVMVLVVIFGFRQFQEFPRFVLVIDAFFIIISLPLFVHLFEIVLNV